MAWSKNICHISQKEPQMECGIGEKHTHRVGIDAPESVWKLKTHSKDLFFELKCKMRVVGCRSCFLWAFQTLKVCTYFTSIKSTPPYYHCVVLPTPSFLMQHLNTIVGPTNSSLTNKCICSKTLNMKRIIKLNTVSGRQWEMRLATRHKYKVALCPWSKTQFNPNGCLKVCYWGKIALVVHICYCTLVDFSDQHSDFIIFFFNFRKLQQVNNCNIFDNVVAGCF